MISVFLFFCFMFIGLLAAIITAIVFLVKTGGNNPQPPQNQPYVYQPVNPKPIKPKKKLSASTIMLLIGTAFIILSAVTFVAANWVSMKPQGRVFALAGAAVLAFAISGIMKAAAGLVRTSSAFYIIGSLVAVISIATAGYYKLFGDWFCINGDGAGLLLAVLMIIASAAAFIGHAIYKNTVFHYVGFSFISAAVMFICVQLTDSFEQFAPMIAMAQLVITAAVHVLKPQKNTLTEKPVRIIGDITAIIFEIMALVYVISVSFEATWYSLAVLGIILIQLFVYGIFKNQKWMFIFANIFAIYTAFTVTDKFENELGEAYVMLLFGFITMIIYLINKAVPNNLTAAKVISFSGAVLGAVVSLFADNEKLFGLNLIVPAAVSLSIAGYGLHKSKDIQTAAGIAAPFLPFFMAMFLYDRLYDFMGKQNGSEIETLVYGGLALAYIAVSAFYSYLPKFAFNFHAHHPRKSQTIVYSNMIMAAAVLMNISEYTQLFVVTVGLCVLHFIVSCSMSCNITAAGSVISLSVLANHVLQHYFGRDSEAEMYIMFGLFALLAAASRIIFPEGFAVKKDDKTVVDVLILGAWTAVIPFPFFDSTANFLRLMAIAVFLACFIKKNTRKDNAAILLSFSAFFTAIAFITRPFLNPDSSMISSKITLAIMMLLGIAYKFIWKNHKEASRIVSTIIFVLSFIGLIVDGLVYSELVNRIFVLCVTAAVLVLSFFIKSKTWFTASSAALVIMTIVFTKKYFDAAGWWIYLLAVGIIFIAIAAVNEALKKKGETMKSTVSKTFSDWTW